ncbi:class I SAM-dependent methyltransferase [Cryptosporangium aurantiacum]|uniref:Methyltransferase domain-containing protein n=1 Tax=Cryptosporangium aurantiacum TaxID=134849 RepID=A0A1M7PD99_9ACTN|nr:class I SAM-dependent methyltransferase [Cryptosporangium aurantiacum]SHN14885.1 Methyltransferase domain-containing protein [Cryptosporangium aurantiacum]
MTARSREVRPAEPGPAPVWDVINGFAAYWALSAAIDLDIFEQLADGPATSAELADATGVSDAADLTLLAQLLTAKGLLDTDGERWSNSAASARFLVPSSAASMVELVRHSPGPKQGWPALASTLRDGRPAAPITDALDALYPALVAATAATQAAVARGVALELRSRGLWDGTGLIVDLGCGSGAWLQSLLAAGAGADPATGAGADPATGADARVGAAADAGAVASAIGVDLPLVLPAAQERLAGHDVTLVAGDYLEADLPSRRAAIVVLAHVLRAESAPRAEALLGRALDLLAEDGVLLVADYFRPPDGASTDTYAAAVHDLTLALTMRASTVGRGITEPTLAAWCATRGAHTVAVVEPVPRQRVHLITSSGGTHGTL